MSNPAPVNLTTTRKRLLFFIIAVIVLFSALAGRLAFIQIFEGRMLQQRATSQWYRELPLRAPRGLILDANGHVLVDNMDVFTVYVRPRGVVDKQATARQLAEVLQLQESRVLERISQTVSAVTVKRKISEAEAERLRVLALPGVYLTPDTQRSYPQNHSLSRVLGFTNIDNVGQNGIEGYYDRFLRGLDGFAFTNTDLVGREIPSTITRYVPAIPGMNVTLSVDREIQHFTDFAVKTATMEWGAKSAAMIVMDVTDGGIKAMSMTPSFDLNHPPRNDIDLLNSLSKNSLIVDVFEPGSTFKIFTTAAAIEHGLVTDNCSFFCRGHHVVDGQRIRCWRTIGHSSQNLAEGVMNSCNVVFMNLGARLGTDKLYDMLEAFGFNAKTNIDFYGESRGILVPRNYVKNIDLARIAFGQAVAVTPLQLITGVSAVVNGGNLMQPHFVRSIVDPHGRSVFERTPTTVRRVISPQTSAKMNELLENVVALGSGKKSQVPGFRIGGKTGTAQKYGPDGNIAQGKYISSFVGFAPVESPRYAILMLVDEPGPGAYYGSIVAAPHVGDVFSRIFDYRNMQPGIIPEPVPTIPMPNMLGMSAVDAAALLKELRITFEMYGIGDRVISTLPIPGVEVAANSVVLLRV